MRRDVLVLVVCLPALVGAEPPTLRHGSYVHSVVFSPDGRYVASASNDETVRIWDVAAGKEHGRLTTEKEYFRAIAFSPDGRRIATGSKEHFVSIWDTATGKRLHRLEDHAGAVHAVAFSPDGRWLLSGGEGAELMVWNVGEGKLSRRLTAPHKQVQAVLFYSDSKHIAAAGKQDTMIVVWDLATGKEVRRSHEKHGGIAALVLSPDGKTLAAAGSGPVRFYDAGSLEEYGHQAVRSEGSVDGIFALAYSFDGKYLATGGQDKSVRLFEVATHEEVRAWKGLHDWVYALAFAPKGRMLAGADHGYAVCLWEVDNRGAEKLARPTAEEGEKLWQALESADGGGAHDAVWRLARLPDWSVPFLRERLAKRPARPDRVGPLLRDLASDEFAKHQQAGRELTGMGRAAEPALRKAMAGPLASLELRRRIEKIVEQIDQPIRDPDILLALRVTAALERMETREARELLKSLSEGEGETWMGMEARGAVKRGGKK